MQYRRYKNVIWSAVQSLASDFGRGPCIYTFLNIMLLPASFSRILWYRSRPVPAWRPKGKYPESLMSLFWYQYTLLPISLPSPLASPLPLPSLLPSSFCLLSYLTSPFSLPSFPFSHPFPSPLSFWPYAFPPRVSNMMFGLDFEHLSSMFNLF